MCARLAMPGELRFLDGLEFEEVTRWSGKEKRLIGAIGTNLIK